MTNTHSQESKTCWTNLASRDIISLDLASGYWKIPLSKEDAHKTTFRTQKGLFRFKQMPFGLSDASSTFQRMVNTVFSAFINQGVVIVYLDDILVHMKSWKEHVIVLQQVLQRNSQV